MTLTAGALFGLLIGTIVVSFASQSEQPWRAFISRFVFKRLGTGEVWEQAQGGQRRDSEGGAFYLFTLRLIPVFFLFGLSIWSMGLTEMPA